MTDNNAVVAAISTKIIFNTLNKETRTVSARELHDRLGVETQFSIWFNRMTEYGFSAENGDYSNSIFFDRVQMARLIPRLTCMMENTKFGKIPKLAYLNIKFGKIPKMA